MEEDEKLTAMAKTIRLASNEAKKTIVQWAETQPEEEDRLCIAILSSIRVAAETLDAVMAVECCETEARTLRNIDDLLMPKIAALRANVSSYKPEAGK